MKESDLDNSSFDKQFNNDEKSLLNSHDEKMESMIENSHSIIKKIKQMSKEITSDLQSQNKIINDIGITMSRTDLQLKKNNSKIDDILVKTSMCSLITLAIIQVIAIIILILL